MRITMQDRTEQYQGAIDITFAPNENITARLADGRIVDLFADGTWQVWTPGGTDPATRTSIAPELLGQGEFHALTGAASKPADEA